MSRQRSRRHRWLFWAALLWVGLNLVAWFGPGLWQAGRRGYRDWLRENQAARYETRSFPEAETASDAAIAKLPYLFYEPPLARTENPSQGKLPLVLVLHGSGERGEDCRSHLATVGTFLIEPAFQSKHPCYVVAPQCPSGVSWRSSNGGSVEKAVVGLLKMLESERPIDPQRVYLVGYSMGAFGSWHYAASMPERYAAGIAVAGGGDPDAAPRLARTPIWAIHGSQDPVVAHRNSQEMVQAVTAVGGTAKLTTLPGLGHDSFRFVRQTPNAYLQWLFQQRKVRQAD